MAAWIGTSGWNYKHWRNTVYPAGLRQADWLSYLSTEWFNTVEINTSFYRIPTDSSVKAWDRTAPEDFRFAVKLWRGITHYRKLNNCREFLERFFGVMDHFSPRHRGPVLIQLPSNQGIDLPKLDSFLSDFKAVAGRRWSAVMEFRNPAWLTGDTYSLLDQRRIALCLHDMRGSAVDRPNAAPLVYIRRHGPTEQRYHGSYTREQIEQDARRISAWVNEGREVFVYYNNDVGGHAVHNARELRSILAAS